MSVRRLVALCMLALLACAATAFASATYSGHLNGHSDQKVAFTKQGASVSNAHLTHLAVHCDGGRQHINPEILGSAPINDAGHFRLNGGPIVFKGVIEGADAHGRVIVDGSFSGSSQNCTADKKWTAKRD
jgi:hypothetical protein